MGAGELAPVSCFGARHTSGGHQQALPEIGIEVSQQAAVVLYGLEQLDRLVDVREERGEDFGIGIGWILHGRET